MRFLLAAVASAALVLGAPFIGQARHWVRTEFPGHFLLIVGGAIGAAVVVALAIAFVRIREHRVQRYGSIAAALAVAILYSIARASTDADANAVERFHFIEYGIVALLFYRAWRPLGGVAAFILPALAGLLVGTLDEWFQWFIPGRVGVMSDVFLDCAAIAAGLLFCAGVNPPVRQPLERTGNAVSDAPRSRTGWSDPTLAQAQWLAAIVIFVFALFFDCVHLGHAIVTSEIGTFASRYTAAELDAQARDRTVRWRTSPPIDKTRLAREDQYRTEGLQHVQARNKAWAAGDAVAAWRENQILERYFGPVLDSGQRWPAAQREDAARRFAGALHDAAFVSDAYPYTLYTWPRPAFWPGVILLEVLVWTAIAWRRRTRGTPRAAV